MWLRGNLAVSTSSSVDRSMVVKLEGVGTSHCGLCGSPACFPPLLTWELTFSLTSSSTLGVIHWPWQEAGRKNGREEGLGEIRGQ